MSEAGFNQAWEVGGLVLRLPPPHPPLHLPSSLSPHLKRNSFTGLLVLTVLPCSCLLDSKRAWWAVRQVCQSHPWSSTEEQLQELVVGEKTCCSGWHTGEEGTTIFRGWGGTGVHFDPRVPTFNHIGPRKRRNLVAVEHFCWFTVFVVVLTVFLYHLVNRKHNLTKCYRHQIWILPLLQWSQENLR